MGRFTLSEFREYYQKFFLENEANQSSLESFFYDIYPKLPLFYNNHFVKIKFKSEYDELDDIESEIKTIIYEIKYHCNDMKKIIVDVENLVGETWVFKNDFSDWRPLAKRLANLFLAKKPEDIVPLSATKISENKYYTDDGNHRIYAAYLRGEKVHIIIEGETLNCNL